MILSDFQGLTEATGGGRGSDTAKIEVTSFMDGPQVKIMVKFLGFFLSLESYK